METPKSPHERSDSGGNTAETRTDAAKIDPAAASAALAEAVRSARQGLKPSPSIKVAQSNEPDAAVRSSGKQRFQTPVLGQAAAALLLIGTGWVASYMGTLANRDAIRKLEAETARSQEILTRLTGDLEALRDTMATFKDVDQTASVSSSADQAKLAEKVERLAIAIQDPGKKLTAIETKLDRMEGQITIALAGLAAKPATPTAAEPTRDAAPAVKPVRNEPVDGWVLREVYDGSALVEGRNRRLYEVMPGGIIPGVGRVEAIERRGTRWVVLTDKGFIGTYR